MAPIWHQDNDAANLYPEVIQHSDEMVSIAYKAPTDRILQDLENLRITK